MNHIMWTVLSALCVLWATPSLGTFVERCPRKEPPPGVVIASLGSELTLTCSGRVSVDGTKVDSTFQDFTANSISQNAVVPKQQVSLNRESEGEINPTHSSPRVNQPFSTKSDWDGEVQDEADEEEKKVHVQWKFNSEDMEGNSEGSTLFLSRLRMNDSGRYSCHHRGTERFSTRVIVADAPEKPSLSCYKKSWNSKIRCEWTPQKPLHKGTSCSLVIRKGLMGEFHTEPCFYSTRRSRCWCARPFDEEDKWTLHQAFLCVSSFISNTTSDLLLFKPSLILKPDPPYNVTVQPQTGLSHSLKVTWRPPNTWRLRDQFYVLIYQLRYKPVISKHFQTINVLSTRHTVTDALAGQEYEVQVRTKDEYEGQWSDWSVPQYGISWKEAPRKDLTTTPPFRYWYSEGSGSGAEDPSEVFTASPEVVSHHYLWVTVLISVGLSLVIFAAYIIRYKQKCVSKLHSLGVLSQCGESVHPRPTVSPAVAEGHALLHTDLPQNEEVKDKREPEPANADRTEATDFDNSSYFFVHRKV